MTAASRAAQGTEDELRRALAAAVAAHEAADSQSASALQLAQRRYHELQRASEVGADLCKAIKMVSSIYAVQRCYLNSSAIVSQANKVWALRTVIYKQHDDSTVVTMTVRPAMVVEAAFFRED